MTISDEVVKIVKKQILQENRKRSFAEWKVKVASPNERRDSLIRWMRLVIF